jgi:hypothetical protein
LITYTLSSLQKLESDENNRAIEFTVTKSRDFERRLSYYLISVSSGKNVTNWSSGSLIPMANQKSKKWGNDSDWEDLVTRDEMFGHQFNKRPESFAPCYSQSLLLADFEENHTLLWF